MPSAQDSTISKVAAFYLWPPVLVGDSPPVSAPTRLEEEMFRRTLRQGITVKILREGIFAFDFSNWPADKNQHQQNALVFDTAVERAVRRVSVMNAYLACFYTAVYRGQQTIPRIMRVLSSTLLQFQSVDDPALEGITRDAFIHAVRTNPDWRRASRSVIVRIETIEKSFQQFELVLDERRTDLIALADVYLRSCLARAEHDYSLALITAWATIEKMLNLMWRKYLDDNRERQADGETAPFISKERRKKLTQDRDFTASVISEILSLADLLPFSVYHGLSDARKARNAWVHDLKPTSRQTAHSAIRVVERLLLLVFKLECEIPFSSGISL